MSKNGPFAGKFGLIGKITELYKNQSMHYLSNIKLSFADKGQYLKELGNNFWVIDFTISSPQWVYMDGHAYREIYVTDFYPFRQVERMEIDDCDIWGIVNISKM